MPNRTTMIIILLVLLGVVGCGGLFLFLTLSRPPLSDAPSSPAQGGTPPIAQGVPADRPSPAIAQPSSATITFAADFANNNGCEAHNSRGCDIYTANIKFDGSVSDLIPQTADDVSEAFPVFSADGTMVYANVNRGKTQGSLEWIDLATSSSGTLQSFARGIAPLPDGKSVVFSALGDPNVLMLANFASPTSLTNAHQISPVGPEDYDEPHASSLGDVVFEKLSGGGRGSNTAQAGVYRSSTGTFLDLTAADGTGHCFWGFGGTSAYCNNSEKFPGTYRVPFENGVPGTPERALKIPKKDLVIAQDPEFAACPTIYIAYGAACDATHIITTLGCETSDSAGKLTLSVSKLVLLDISTPAQTMTPIGKNLADAFGGSGSSSYTVSCRMN